jgi:protein ImuB
MSRRIACISLPDIRVEIARENARQGREFGSRNSSRDFLAVIVARAGSAVQVERDVQGNTRIDFVSRDANALGVHPGQTVAAARAKCAELHVCVVAEGAVRTALARIAEAVLAFGPATSFDMSQDVVWVDVSGCAHLHGGEIELARAIGKRVSSLGYACCVAIADGPRIAAAIARFGASESIVAPEGKGAAVVRSLPIIALGLDEDMSEWLMDLGLRTCGDLQKLPRRALGLRLGERVKDVMEFLDGRDHAPLEVWRPPDVPEERIELDWAASSVEALAFVMNLLCDRLAVRLRGRAMAAARLELVLTLDRALCDQSLDVGSHRLTLSVVLPSPIIRAPDLLAIVCARLETCALAAPVVAVTLRAPELARVASRTLDWLLPRPKADYALPRLVAELSAELAENTVGLLELVDTWLPTERTRLVPYGSRSEKTTHSLVTSALEPSRLVCATSQPTAARPKGTAATLQISRGALVRAKHLVRIEAVQWWRHAPAAHESSRYDLFMAWVDGSLAWLELGDPSQQARLCGWMD